MQPNSSSQVLFSQRHGAELGGEPVIDQDAFAVLESLADEDDPDLVKEIVELYLEDSAGRMSQIEQGLQGEGANIIRAAAHALKSASANVGALHFSSACASLEDAAVDGSESGLTELVAEAVKLYEDVRSALSGVVSSDG